MNRFTPTLVCLALAGLAHLSASGQDAGKSQPKKDAPPPKVELLPVKMKDLVEKHIAGHKGKVVVVYVWAVYSAPDKIKFAGLLRFHASHAEKGLACISIDVDPNEQYRKRALRFLQDNKAVFANYWVEEGPEAVAKHWKIEPTAAYIIYDRQGKVAKVFSNDGVDGKPFTAKDVEAVLKKLLEPGRDPAKGK